MAQAEQVYIGLRFLFIGMIFLFGSVLASHSVGKKSPNNLILNSGLEQDGIREGATAWVGYANGKGNDAAFGVTNEMARIGNHSYGATIYSASGEHPWDIAVGPSGIPVEANKRYHFSYWVHGEEGMKLDTVITTRAAPWTQFADSGLRVLKGGWERISFDLTMGEAESVRVTTQLNFKENNGKKIYIDDAEMYVITH